MPIRSTWKLLLVSLLAFFIVACKPIASFSVNPDPVRAGVEATFDASASMVHTKPKGNQVKSYTWSFGDGGTGSGRTVRHTYAAPGTYTVKLTVIDTAGREGVIEESLVVQPGEETAPTTSLQVITQIAGGASLSGAEVALGAVTGTSNADGVVTLADVPVGEDQVITIRRSGYVTQVVRTTLSADTDGQQILVLLMPEKDTLSIANVEQAQVIGSNFLGASVSLPANALVDATTGAIATGSATLKLTPWDISGIDLQATLGNGRARNAQGDLVDLVSGGMLTVNFFDAAGNKLQVASGQSADIQLDFPAGVTGIGGNALAVGTVIPMWSFNEALGLWEEEGTGTVVATPTGLAVRATVRHFSTWIWAFPVQNSGSVNVRCVNPSNQSVPCTLIAEVTLADGSRVTQSLPLTASVTTVLNVPANSVIQWKAATANGLVGSVVSNNDATVVINLFSPITDNFVQCTLPDGSVIRCEIRLTAPLANGGVGTTDRYVPAEGTNVRTVLNTAGPLTWTAVSPATLAANGQWTVYSGTATSITSGSVSIALTPSSVGSGKMILFSCAPTYIDQEGRSRPLLGCTASGAVTDASGREVASFSNINALVPTAWELPPGGTFTAFLLGNVLGLSSNEFTVSEQNVTDGQSVVVQLRQQQPF